MGTHRHTASTEIKQKNRTNLYRLLYRQDRLSRQEIVHTLQLSLPTVTQNLDELRNQGLIERSGSIGNTGGRRAGIYSIVQDARIAIGLDITRHHITAVAVDLRGNIIATLRQRRDFSRREEYYGSLGETIETLIEQGKLDRNRILGVGIGVPCLITQDNQTVFYGEILGCTGATRDEFSKYIPFSTELYNDAKAAGFAETWANPDIQNAFYIMLSNNVGGAVYINGAPYCGENNRSGEVGHLTIVPDGKDCYCGQKGCVDAYCAATVLSSLTDGNLPDFFQRLETGDETATTAWETYLHRLADTVTQLRIVYDCPIVIGGYIGGYIDRYLEDLKKRVICHSSFDADADFLRPCRYKKEAIAAGAALHFVADFLETI